VSCDPGVFGTFGSPQQAAQAIRALRALGITDVRAAMAAPYPEVVAALGRPRSPIAFVALPGAAAGIGGGLALTILTSISWRLVTGGKPVVSLPPFVVISFELAVLAGSLATLAAVLLGGWRGGRAATFPISPRLGGHRLGVYAVGGDGAAAARALRESGAIEVVDVP
jgi:hypothetical protein